MDDNPVREQREPSAAGTPPVVQTSTAEGAERQLAAIGQTNNSAAASCVVTTTPFAEPDEEIEETGEVDNDFDPAQVERVMRRHHALEEPQAVAMLRAWLSNGQRSLKDGTFGLELGERVGCTLGTIRHLRDGLDQKRIDADAAVGHVLRVFHENEDLPVNCCGQLFGYRDVLGGMPVGIFHRSGYPDLYELYMQESGEPCAVEALDPFGGAAFTAALALCTDDSFFDDDRRPKGLNLANGFLAVEEGRPVLRPHHPRWRATYAYPLIFDSRGLQGLIWDAAVVMPPAAHADFVEHVRATFPTVSSGAVQC